MVSYKYYVLYPTKCRLPIFQNANIQASATLLCMLLLTIDAGMAKRSVLTSVGPCLMWKNAHCNYLPYHFWWVYMFLTSQNMLIVNKTSLPVSFLVCLHCFKHCMWTYCSDPLQQQGVTSWFERLSSVDWQMRHIAGSSKVWIENNCSTGLKGQQP